MRASLVGGLGRRCFSAVWHVKKCCPVGALRYVMSSTAYIDSVGNILREQPWTGWQNAPTDGRYIAIQGDPLLQLSSPSTPWYP